MEAMTEQEMKSVLVEMTDSAQLIAILKYAAARMEMAKNSLITIDPFKEPAQMARFQGIVTGVLDLPDAIWQLKKAVEEGEKPQNS